MVGHQHDKFAKRLNCVCGSSRRSRSKSQCHVDFLTKPNPLTTCYLVDHQQGKFARRLNQACMPSRRSGSTSQCHSEVLTELRACCKWPAQAMHLFVDSIVPSFLRTITWSHAKRAHKWDWGFHLVKAGLVGHCLLLQVPRRRTRPLHGLRPQMNHEA